MPIVLGGPWQGGFFGDSELAVSASGTLTEGTPPPSGVGSLRFYDQITQGDYEGRCRIALPNAGIGINVEQDFTYDFRLAPSAIAADNPLSTSAGPNNNWINSNITIDRDMFGQLPAHGFGLSGGQACFGVSTSSGELTLIGGPDMRDGLWHAVRLQRNGTTGQMDIFVDGTRVATGTGPLGSVARPNGQTPSNSCGPTGTEPCTNSDPFFVIGTEKHDVLDAGYRGLFTELRVSNIVREAGTSYTPATAPFSADANTVGLWHFDEGSGTVSIDDSGNGQDCVLEVDALGPTWEPNTPFTPTGNLVTTLTFDNPDAQSHSGRAGEVFGQGFARGDIPSGDRPQAWIGGVSVPTQVEQTSTWPDGSLRYARLFVASGDFTASETKTVELRDSGTAPSGTNIALTDLPAGVLADMTLGAETLDCSAAILQSPPTGATLVNTFTGPHCAEWIYRPRYTTVPRVRAAFHLIAYRSATSGAVDRIEWSGGNECVDIRRTLQDHGTVPSSLHRFRVGGSTVYSETAVMYQYSRWHRWEELPVIHVRHDHAYLESTGLIPPVRPGFNVLAAALTNYQSEYNSNDGINQSRGWREDMSIGGTDPDIGLVAGWDQCYRVAANGSSGRDWRDNVWLRSEGGGRHQVHYYDEDQGRPVQIGPGAGQFNNGDAGFGTGGLNPDLGVSTFWGSFPDATWTTAGTDLAHQPRFGYTQYLLFGRHFFLEEQQYWGAMCCGNGDGAYQSATKYNLVCWDQVRAEAWGTASIMCAAVLAPDGDAMRTYFEAALARNIVEAWDENYAPGQVGHSVLGCVVPRYPTERDNLLGYPESISVFEADFCSTVFVWAWMMGYDGTDTGLPDYTDYSEWAARWTVGRVHKLGAASAPLYFADLNVATNSPPNSWDEFRIQLYQFNTNENEAIRPQVWNDTRNDSVVQQEFPDSADWRAGWSTGGLGATDCIGFTDQPASDQVIVQTSLAYAIMRGTPGAQSAWDKFQALDLVSNTGSPTVTEQGGATGEPAQPQFDLWHNSAFPHQDDPLSPFIQGIAVGSTWINYRDNLGAPFTAHYRSAEYSSAVQVDSILTVIGGGHNSGVWDGVYTLDMRRFETQGWRQEMRSSAEVTGNADEPWSWASSYFNARYDLSEAAGGIRDERGAVRLSPHTYDALAPLPLENGRPVGFINIHGVLPYDTWLPPNPPWGQKAGDIWKYRFNEGWEYITQYGPIGVRQSCAFAGLERSTGLIWIVGELQTAFNNDVYTFDPATDQLTLISDNAGPVTEEDSGAMNEDAGEFVVGFGFGATPWTRFNLSTQQFTTQIASGGDFNTSPSVRVPAIVYVPTRFGSDYGTYFGYDTVTGVLRRRDPGTGNWTTIANLGPTTDGHVYGKFGFDEGHQVFYVVSQRGLGLSWNFHMVRPYAYNPNEGYA